MDLITKIRHLLGGARQERPVLQAPASQPDQTPLTRRVLMIVHNPDIASEGGRRLHRVLGWNEPDTLARRYITDVRQASHGFANYEIVEHNVVDAFPEKEDNFVYTAETYLRCWRQRSSFHQPDQVNYQRLLDDYQIVAKINRDEIDEVWLFGFPYAGYYESIMVGPHAFWCNAPPLNRPECQRRFVIMGFNYERGQGEMLESFGHRVESIMAQVYRSKQGSSNLWERFTRHEKKHPGQAECGNVHYAPNSERDYDWGNRRYVQSGCDDWRTFPHLSGEKRLVNCQEWGNGDIRLHHLWWLSHLPHVGGSTGGILNNWWTYILDPNQVPS